MSRLWPVVATDKAIFANSCVLATLSFLTTAGMPIRCSIVHVVGMTSVNNLGLDRAQPAAGIGSTVRIFRVS